MVKYICAAVACVCCVIWLTCEAHLSIKFYKAHLAKKTLETSSPQASAPTASSGAAARPPCPTRPSARSTTSSASSLAPAFPFSSSSSATAARLRVADEDPPMAVARPLYGRVAGEAVYVVEPVSAPARRGSPTKGCLGAMRQVAGPRR
jgi:hypothetical protein